MLKVNFLKLLIFHLLLTTISIYSIENSYKSSYTPVQKIRTHGAGILSLDITNSGYLCNPDSLPDPVFGGIASGCEMPGRSGSKYLKVASLWFGGYIDSTVTRDGAHIFQGPLVSTGYEGWRGLEGKNDMPKELWPVNFSSDPSGMNLGNISESSDIHGKKNYLNQEVYDSLATADEIFQTMFTDKYINRDFTGHGEYDNREHIPLGIEVKRKTYTWGYNSNYQFIIADYTLYNRNESGRDIYDFFVANYLDADIGNDDWSNNSTEYHADDLCGYMRNWTGYIDPGTGEADTLSTNIFWFA